MPSCVFRKCTNYTGTSAKCKKDVCFHLTAMFRLRSLTKLRSMGARLYGEFHDHLDHVTGIEKRELLAYLAGDCDPWRILSIKKGPGTRERPNLIPSSNPSRLMCCRCDPSDNHLEFMWLHQGCPKRCGCGYWFELCPVAPL